MERNLRLNIQRLGKTLTVICRIARIIFVILTVFSLMGAVACIAAPGAIQYIQLFFSQNTIYLLLNEFIELGSMDPKFAGAIGCGISAITFTMFSLFTRGFQRMISSLIESEKPFTRETAKRIRRASFLVLLAVFYNPFAGLIIFLIALLLSYLVDYGAYIQEKADATSGIQEEMIVSFAEITENKSGQTGQHIRRVSEYSKILALEMGLSPEQAEDLRLASTMHDIGKLMIPGEILEKPGR
ncbi:MAG: HD domain-containing protein, partial [Lachnospiraceae bacterium]|nr:HD domain-containing protein [Lachnospiraceae bacterium]